VIKDSRSQYGVADLSEANTAENSVIESKYQIKATLTIALPKKIR
jgi:hypothetical protein